MRYSLHNYIEIFGRIAIAREIKELASYNRISYIASYLQLVTIKQNSAFKS